MSDKELEDKLNLVAPDCKPKVKHGWVRLEGEVGDKDQMAQMDAAFRIVEEHDKAALLEEREKQ